VKTQNIIILITVCSFMMSGCCSNCFSDQSSNKSVSPSPAKLSHQNTPDKVTETIERYYYIKGMTCGGCAFGVKQALKKAGLSKQQIIEVDYSSPDPDNQIGHAKVAFAKADYLGIETDCKIIKTIKKSPGYIAYWDKKIQTPCDK
jgi:copper chaperone CopZ